MLPVAAPGADRVTATLEIVVSKVDAHGATAIASIDGLAPSATNARGIQSAPFALQIGRDCRFMAFGFPQGTPASIANRARQLLASFEVVLSARGETQWVRLESDNVGQYSAEYTRDGSHVRKRRQAYRTLFDTDGLSVDVTSSHVTAELAADGRWLASLEGKEQLKLRLGNPWRADSPQFAVTLNARFSARAVAPSGRLEAPLATPTWTWLADGAPPLPTSVRDNEAPPDPRLRGLTLANVVQEMEAIRRADRVSGSARAGDLLAAWLRANPAEAARVVAALRAGEVPMELHSAVFFGLEKAGTPEAHDALADALVRPGLDVVDRARAASALSDVPRPTDATLAALDTVSRAPMGAEHTALETAATYAMGTLEHNTLATQPLLADAAHSLLRERVLAPRSGKELKAALGAVYNSRNVAYLPEVVALMSSDDLAGRLGAYTALTGMPPASTGDLFLGAYEQESEDPVRSRAVGAFVKQTRVSGEPPMPEVVEQAADALTFEAGSETREQLIRLLGEAARAGGVVATAALVAHFHRERVPELLELIGHYIGAEELL